MQSLLIKSTYINLVQFTKDLKSRLKRLPGPMSDKEATSGPEKVQLG